MTGPAWEHPEFLELLGALREGRITPEQFSRLDRWLADDPAAQRCYVEYMLLCAELRRYHGSPKLQEEVPTGPEWNIDIGVADGAESSAAKGVDAMLDEIIEQDRRAERRLSGEETRHQDETRKETIRKVAEAALEKYREQERIRIEELAYRQYRAQRRQMMVGGFAVTVLLLLAALSWLARWNVGPADSPLAAAPAPAPPPVVARIARSSDAQWLDAGLSTLPGTQLRPSSMYLTQGFVELACDGGTAVLLQAPVAVRLETSERLFLERGTLSVRIGEDSNGFIVCTPTGTVVDYGTQFGVLVNSHGETETLVYEGKVGLRSGSDPVRAVTSMILTEGQAGVVEAGGRLASTAFDAGRVVRSMPETPGFGIPGRRVDLADIVAGGNGLGTGGPNAGINPATGGQVAPVEQDRTGSGQYVPVAWNRYIDGVFVPNRGMAQTVSSEGHRFAECPPTNNVFYLDITNTIGAGLDPQRLGDCDYGTRDRPCILMHANLGITFDLKAIRQSSPGARVARFRSGFGVSESGTDRPCNADFWVLVDGQVRFSRLKVREKGLAGKVDMELLDLDRFLTLVTTDGGDKDTTLASGRATDSDWCVFAGPCIELAATQDPRQGAEETKPNTDRIVSGR